MKKVNKSIATTCSSTFVLSETASQQDYDMYENFMSSQEEYVKGLATEVSKSYSDNIIWVEVEQPITETNNSLLLYNFKGETVIVDTSKETEFTEHIKGLHRGDVMQIYTERNKTELKGSFKDLQTELTFHDLHQSMIESNSAFTGIVVDKNDGGFFLDINGITVFLPGSQATANKVENFDLANWLGREIMVMVETFHTKNQIFVVSNKKYLKTIKPTMIKELDFNTKYKGKVTGSQPFGIFVEFYGGVFTGLIHKMEMDDEMLVRFETIRPTDEVEFYIKEIQKDDRIVLTTIDYIKTKKELNTWFMEHKGIEFDVKVKKYNKHTSEYLVKIVNDKIPNYAKYGVLKSKTRLTRDDIISVTLSSLQHQKMKLVFKQE